MRESFRTCFLGVDFLRWIGADRTGCGSGDAVSQPGGPVSHVMKVSPACHRAPSDCRSEAPIGIAGDGHPKALGDTGGTHILETADIYGPHPCRPQGAEATPDQGAGAPGSAALRGRRRAARRDFRKIERTACAAGKGRIRVARAPGGATRRIATPSARDAFRGVANITHEIAVSGARPVGLHAPWAASRQSESGVASPVK